VGDAINLISSDIDGHNEEKSEVAKERRQR